METAEPPDAALALAGWPAACAIARRCSEGLPRSAAAAMRKGGVRRDTQRERQRHSQRDSQRDGQRPTGTESARRSDSSRMWHVLVGVVVLGVALAAGGIGTWTARL